MDGLFISRSADKYTVSPEWRRGMEVIVKGQPQKVSKKLVREAINFYAPLLMTSRMIDTLQIYINFKPKEQMDCYAETDGTYDKESTPRIFDIDIKDAMSYYKTLLVLAHEMVHVKQMATGQLKEMVRTGKIRYQGKLYKDHPGEEAKYTEDYFRYLETPWEIEAHGREYSLYARFLQHLKDKKKKS